MPAPEFPAFLERSLDLLQSETPRAYEEMATTLARTPVRIVVDGQPRVLRFSPGEHVLDEVGDAAGELRTSGETILALIDGEQRLLDAILREELFLRGPVEVVARFERALTAFLAGSVRAPGFPSLLHAYRDHVSAAR